MFTKENVSRDQFPPTLDILVFHLHRANCQTFICKSACVPVLNLQLPIGNGLQTEDEKICEELMLNSSVPNAIVEPMRCKCKKGFKTNSCSSKCANLGCTDSCSCNINDDCENKYRYKLYESDKEENNSDQ